jgi:hypothetical protein
MLHVKEGDIITLLPFEWEPVQEAEYLGYEGNGIHMVCVLPEFRNDPSDDGLRECGSEQIKELTGESK